jgi:hypothetical protein
LIERERLNLADRTLQDQRFNAVVVVMRHMRRRNDQVVLSMLP